MTLPITLYTSKVCPYAHRVEITLEEAGAKYKVHHIDLQNKPEWYASKVNPASKVPTIAYGGPDAPPEDPSPDSVKLAESLVLIEFVADLFPEANLLPKDPVFRAKARFFNEIVNSKFIPAYVKFVIRGEGYEDLLVAIGAIQDILPDTGKYAVGDQFTLADIAFTPFVARLKLTTSNELGNFPVGQGSEFFQALSDKKYAKFYAYAERLLERKSGETTFNAEYVKGVLKKRYGRA